MYVYMHTHMHIHVVYILMIGRLNSSEHIHIVTALLLTISCVMQQTNNTIKNEVNTIFSLEIVVDILI